MPRALRRSARLVAVLVVLILAMTGCTAMHRVPVAPTAAAPSRLPITSGDEIRISLRGGQKVECTVASVTPEAIVSREGSRYQVADIVLLERRQFSGRRTALLILGIPVAAFGFALLAFAIEGK